MIATMKVFGLFASIQLLAGMAHAHFALTSPLSRNAIDADEQPWAGGVPYPVPFEPWCPFPGENGLSGANGQACFWFSNGCTIGCDKCDGNTRGPIPDFSRNPNPGKKEPACPVTEKTKATICDPALRTVNTDAECGSDEDYYYYSPWRAPGSAPVFDSCGMAGGRLGGPGGYGATYTNTTHAKQGDLGSNLPPRPTGTVWKAGSVVEVSFSLQANHGGGYQYRLCPANQPLTEECFFKMPLKFTGKQSFRWGQGPNSTQIWFNGTYVSEGTLPEGSTWAMNPIPRNDTRQTGQSFKPRCEEVPDCGSTENNSHCHCSGMWGPYNLSVIDYLEVPSDLAPGEYVLGYRIDCEESSQVWSSCADLTVVA